MGEHWYKVIYSWYNLVSEWYKPAQKPYARAPEAAAAVLRRSALVPGRGVAIGRPLRAASYRSGRIRSMRMARREARWELDGLSTAIVSPPSHTRPSSRANPCTLPTRPGLK